MRVWRPIRGFPNYAVSNTGEVHNRIRRTALNPWVDRTGRYKVTLFEGGRRHERYVHRLVAEAFLDTFYPGMHICWKDGNNKNNRADNLELKAERWAPRASLTSVSYSGKKVLIPETGQVFQNVYACARYINGDISNIYNVLAGRRKTHRGFSFRYIEDKDEGPVWR